MTKAISYAKLVPKNKEYKVYFNGLEADVVQASNACFSSAIAEECVVVEIKCDFDIDPAKISVGPQSLSIVPTVDNRTIRFTLNEPKDVVVWTKNKHQTNPLFIFVNKPEEKPQAVIFQEQQRDLIFFPAGQIYEIGHLEVEDGATVYLEEGAFVRGRIWSKGTKGVTIAGRGVLDGSFFSGKESNHTIRFSECTEIKIKDIIVINPSTWMIVIGGSDEVLIKGVREIGQVVGSDGVDLVGTSNALVEGCFVYNNDDCIVIKTKDMKRDNDIRNWGKNVENILVRNCIYLNGPSGNAIEVGHELSSDYVRNIVFENIDILAVHGHGAALSIHAGDRALVSDIIFRNIRIEHAYDRVFDVRVMKSQFNHDVERGQIQNILFENIDIQYSKDNWGYTVSIVSGYDENHMVDTIVFKDVKINGEKVKSPDILDMSFRQTKNVSFV